MKDIDALMYISEQTTPDENIVTDVNVYDKHGVFFVEFDSILHSFDVINRNARAYISSNIEECLQTERIQSMLKDNAWYGEQDHPLQMTVNGKLTPERLKRIYMPNRSHKIMRPSFKNNMLYAHIQTASGTEAGEGFAKEIIQGLIPAFSCRAIAVLKYLNGVPTVMVRQVITYDWVLYPSHKEAHATSEAKGTVKKIQTVTESVKERFKTFSEDVMVPLKDLLGNVGKDPSLQVVMESFDLTEDEIVGFTPRRDRAILQSGDNRIFVKVDPKTVNEVEDFYRSFNL